MCYSNIIPRLYGNGGACSGCGQAIPANEFVTRAGGAVFHTKCFSCSKCGTVLNTGDRYCLLSGSPVCESDWHKMVKSSSVAAAAVGNVTGNSGAPVRKAKVQPTTPLVVSPVASSSSSSTQASIQASPSSGVLQSGQVDVVDVGVGGDPYSPPPPGHPHYNHHHHHHHHQQQQHHHHHLHQQMTIGLHGLAHQQPPHLQPHTSYQEWSQWGEPCD
ncbi:hypothetical protein PV325_002083 [Microctonus aethiopoides]|nr:hypothetical protein PV325_002083 [Microctonus aethiopoides]